MERPEDQARTEEWILESVEIEATEAVRRGSRGGRGRSRARTGQPGDRSRSDDEVQPVDLVGGAHAARTGEVFDGMGSAKRTASLQKRLDEASRAFKRERFGDALKVLRPLVDDAPGVPEVHELAGLAYYRQGRWKDAARELKVFAKLTGSTEQHPVLADCARAMGRYGLVEEYWDALRRASPSADLVVEGRIVMAGSLADQGRLTEAVNLMEAGRRKVKRPKERHLRMAYVLADLHERAGDLPAARSGFGWLASHDPDFADVEERLAALR